MYTFTSTGPPEQNVIQEYLDFRDRYNVPIWLGESGENNDKWVVEFEAAREKRHRLVLLALQEDVKDFRARLLRQAPALG